MDVAAPYVVVRQQPDGTYLTCSSAIIPQPASAQLAEITALTKALELSQGQAVNIYTDSAYAHAAVHLDGPQWLRRGFLTSSGQPMRHHQPLKVLSESVALPAQVGVIKCKGHSAAGDADTLRCNGPRSQTCQPC
ncbi:hypothetical protein DPEC_G00079450 [Dallia pectoralis]|uniref:Uncharacterized protein n=1 Tax=Dallia pectoralis TaxID=75939 RepID=A0ACC2H4E4_DALPE|nr:hypothetical protein DPEC_G00079450 [Dallia pectoralis]